MKDDYHLLVETFRSAFLNKFDTLKNLKDILKSLRNNPEYLKYAGHDLLAYIGSIDELKRTSLNNDGKKRFNEAPGKHIELIDEVLSFINNDIKDGRFF